MRIAPGAARFVQAASQLRGLPRHSAPQNGWFSNCLLGLEDRRTNAKKAYGDALQLRGSVAPLRRADELLSASAADDSAAS